MKPTTLDLERAAYVRAITGWHGVSGSELAQIMGCSQTAASKKLQGIRAFTTDEFLAICDTFGVEPRHLLRPPNLSELLGFPQWFNTEPWTSTSESESACTRIPRFALAA